MRISDWSSDVCSSDLHGRDAINLARERGKFLMKLLFILALLLAWPTYGLSLLAWITLWVISNKNQSENGQPNKMTASRPVMYQSKQVPSWAGDRHKNETVVLGIQNRERKSTRRNSIY